MLLLDETAWAAVISGAAVLLSGIVTVWGVRIQTRANERTSERTTEIEHSKVSLEAYEDARETWRLQVGDLREQVAELRGQVHEYGRQSELDQRKIQLLTLRVESLTVYTRVLVELLRANGIAYPEAPPGVADELLP